MPPPSITPLYSLLLEVLADAVTLLSAPIERVLAHLCKHSLPFSLSHINFVLTECSDVCSMDVAVGCRHCIAAFARCCQNLTNDGSSRVPWHVRFSMQTTNDL